MNLQYIFGTCILFYMISITNIIFGVNVDLANKYISRGVHQPKSYSAGGKLIFPWDVVKSPAATMAVNRVVDLVLGANMQPSGEQAKQIHERCSRISAAVKMFREREWLERRNKRKKSSRHTSKPVFSLCYKVMYRGSKLIQRFVLALPTRLRICRRCSSDSSEDVIDVQYDNIASRFFSINDRINCLVIQPYIKWGPKKVLSTTPELQLSEAVSLVRSLNNWIIADKITVPLMSFEKTALFGSGTLQKLQQKLASDGTINAVFISISMLKLHQIQELERLLKVMVFDRYKIVVNILRLHALSNEAKLQVSLAEIPYLRSQINHPVMMSAGKTEIARKNLLKLKEKRVKNQLEKLRNQRQLIRKRRINQDFIIVSVIGYTNAGKTSLIKALTNDVHLKPRDYLFATLDVTTHMGYLASKLPVLYTDTVGFMANIPTNLIECFLSTLEDAMIADVIIHIQNLAHPDFHHQNKHVEDVLKNLTMKLLENKSITEKPIIKVANKVDMKLIPDNELDPDLLCISSKTLEGIDTLKNKLENLVIKVTNRKKIKIRLKSGSEEMSWLYKNGTVVQVEADENNNEYSLITVILTEAKINQFQHYFIKNNRNTVTNN